MRNETTSICSTIHFFTMIDTEFPTTYQPEAQQHRRYVHGMLSWSWVFQHRQGNAIQGWDSQESLQPSQREARKKQHDVVKTQAKYMAATLIQYGGITTSDEERVKGCIRQSQIARTWMAGSTWCTRRRMTSIRLGTICTECGRCTKRESSAISIRRYIRITVIRNRSSTYLRQSSQRLLPCRK